MLAGIVPGEVAVVETGGDLAGPLFPEEEALLARAVDKRRREFTTGRHCARAALRELGVAPVAILRGEKGEPLWPAGVVGSLTHCAGYRAAAVARAEDVVTMGIDAEPHEPLPDGILDQIAGPTEMAHLAELRDGCDWDRLLFCAKEATYKAWFPLARRWLGFHDAEVTIDPVGWTFSSRLLVPGPVTGFSGRFVATPAHLLAAIVIPIGG